MTIHPAPITIDELNALVAERYAREAAEMQRLLALQAPAPRRPPSRARPRARSSTGRVGRGYRQE